MPTLTSKVIVGGLCTWLALTLNGCGGEPTPDREAVREVVIGFFRDVADDDIEGICDKLTATGRAQAIGRPTAGGRPPAPATDEQCVSDGAHVPRSYVDLPPAVRSRELRVKEVEVAGKRARVVLAFAALTGIERLSKTDDGWKLDFFDPVVRE